MVACPTCDADNPLGSRFCNGCGGPLVAAPGLEERKVVTALFCDLVGFTATAEAADPEDIDRMLTAYFTIARKQIESHGGVVEKFIGDAVLGVFGVPAAHEDDPERAVRAGLRIVEDIADLDALGGTPLRIRIGINTGEALVRLGVAPGAGERFLAGDAINSASRLQAIAPEMGIAVGLATYEATMTIFDYAELEPAALKGKAKPMRVFHAKAARASVGADLTRTHDSPFIGREIDLALLKGIFDKAVAASSVQLVTVVGEPGLGKSRIVAELGAYIDARPGLVTWRQGRCLPYGEGITFWALGEIVKALAGILESDAQDIATAKLDVVLPEGPERAWFRQRLLPLLGIEASSSAEREELFTAWRRFLEHFAETGPTVLVFEDLHWADDTMITFLEHLADRAEGVPLLVIGTARPEFFERHREYAAGMRNANVVELQPLSVEETARLVDALLKTTAVTAELKAPILERAEGNPLYAEEFVRLLRDRDLLVQDGGAWALREGADVPLPETVQALIAARLDTLASDAKAMLADAAVVGKVFWAGAIAAMAGRDLADVTETLREFSRKELVRVARRSSMAGEAEYAFWHVLTRDVAYAQLPRASRAARHVAAAAWIESKASDRVEDLADVLAYHYATALELARSAGQTEQATDLEATARRFLTLAGDRALGLDTGVALGNFERALLVTPADHPGRPEALARFGEAAFQAGRTIEAAAATEEAIALLRARGDVVAAARAMVILSIVLGRLGDPRTWALPGEALALLEPLPPNRELVSALTEVARAEAIQGRSASAIGSAEQALTLAEALGLERPARALGFRGMARCTLGDPRGIEDFRSAIALATEAGQGREVALLHNNLGVMLWMFEGPVASLDVLRTGLAFAQSRGLAETADAITGSTLDPLIDSGQLDAALGVADEIADRLEASGAVQDLIELRAARVRILTLRGQAARVAGSLDWLESASRDAGDPFYAVHALGSSTLARAGLGQDDAAASLLGELIATPGTHESEFYPVLLPAFVRTALGIGDPVLAERFARGLEPRYPYAEHAIVTANAALAESRGDLPAAVDAYAAAAARWGQFGIVPEQAFALLGVGRCLIPLGRQAEAALPLSGAREIFARLGAAPALAETDALLAEATAPRS